MEDPNGWDRSTASIAAAGTSDARLARRFLVHQGVVTPREGGMALLAAAIAEVEAQGPITGPSPPLRIAQLLVAADSREAAAAKDPCGLAAVKAFEEWSRGEPGRVRSSKLLFRGLASAVVFALLISGILAKFRDRRYVDVLWPEGVAGGLVYGACIVALGKRGRLGR